MAKRIAVIGVNSNLSGVDIGNPRLLSDAFYSKNDKII